MLNTDTIAKYFLINEIGVGTFGTAWKAVDLETEKIVCVKIFDPIKLQKTRFKSKQLESSNLLLKSVSSVNFSHLLDQVDDNEKIGAEAMMMDESSFVSLKKGT